MIMYDLYPCQFETLARVELEAAIQRRTQVVPISSDVVLARVLTRYKMFLRTSDLGFGCHVMMDGYWEIWLTRFLARTLQPGMRVIDVEANFGYYTMLMADIVGSAGAVIAVEPNPDTAALLLRSVQLNGYAGYTEVLQAALGAEDAESAQFFAPDGEPKNAAIGGAHGRAGQEMTVPVTCLDKIAGRWGPIDFIKIDAEGSEEAIIAGMGSVLANSPPAMVLEFNAHRGNDPRGLLSRLLAVYGKVAEIGFDSALVPVTADTLLTSCPGEDRLLYFSLDRG